MTKNVPETPASQAELKELAARALAVMAKVSQPGCGSCPPLFSIST